MLTNEVMGLLALGILWVNTLLVAGAALARARDISALRRSLLTRGVLEGKLSETGAVLAIDQVGRYGAGKERSILWHHRSHRSEIRGGEIEAGNRRLSLAATRSAMVWTDERSASEAAACRSRHEFDAAFADARKARGHARTLEIVLERGSHVWVVGDVRDAAGVESIEGTDERRVLVSTIDPVVWCRGRSAALALAFVPSIVALAAAVTWLAFYPPVLGHVSMLGGALGLLFFLLVLPAGTAIRDWARAPHERFVRGRWVEPSAGAAKTAQA